MELSEINGARYFAEGTYDVEHRVIDMTETASKTAIEVAQARHVTPVRTIMIGYVAIVLILTSATVVLAALASAQAWPWQVTVGAFAVIAALVIPTRTLLAKVVEQMFKAHGDD